MRRINPKKAFTLAEVLITLGIIGVVAAMTIPILMQNAQKQELKSSLKEAYSMLSQAFNNLQSDQGSLGDWSSLYSYYRNGSPPINTTQFATDLTSYLSVVKDCGSFGCISSSGVGPNGIIYKDFGGAAWGTNINAHYVGTYQYILKNGMILFVWAPNMTSNTSISIDVNGYKGPNVLGKDVFRFMVTSNALMPLNYVWPANGPCNTANANTNVFGCPSAAFTDDNYWNLW